MARPLVIFHKNCPSGDGFGAAFAAWLKFGDAAEYLPADYGNPLPEVASRDVYILDLSFPQEVLEAVGRRAASLTLLDHHRTAQTSLAHFKPACCGRIHFDMARCGAVLAWEHFHPDKRVPRLFRWIQARDLWTWDEPMAKEFLSWLDVQEKSFQRWSEVMQLSAAELETALLQGEALLRQRQLLCESACQTAAPVSLLGQQGLMVNAGGDLRSEIGTMLAERCGTFGLVWRVAEDASVLCSLRAVKPFDVERIALHFGGGGHRSSASFRLPLSRLTELVRGGLER